RIGHPRYRWRALLTASARAITSGHFAESDRYVTEVVQLAALVDDPTIGMALATHEVMRARIFRRDDEMPELLEKLAHAMRHAAQASVMLLIVRAGCFARMHDVAGTREELAKIGARAPALESGTAAPGPLAEAYALVGADDDRRRLRAALLRMETKHLDG